MQQLENIIFNYFNQDNNLYDEGFLAVKPAQIRDKYLSLKGYLKKNYKTGDKIAIYIKKDYQYVIVMLVCLELGLTFVPLNKKFPKVNINNVIIVRI